MTTTVYSNGTLIVPAWLNDVDAATYVKLANVTTISAAAATVLDDASTSAMLTTLGGAPLASPTFTGTPSLPSGTVGVTAAASDNDTSLATTAFVQQELTSQTVKLTGNQTIAGTKTFSTTPVVPTQSMVRLAVANGYGSTNTKIRRFTTTVTSQGTDISYADSATLGASITINANGVYSFSYSECFSTAAYMGFSLNTSQPTTSIQSITEADKLSIGISTGANGTGFVSWTGYLASGAVIRPHGDGTTTGANATVQFTAVRLG